MYCRSRSHSDRTELLYRYLHSLTVAVDTRCGRDVGVVVYAFSGRDRRDDTPETQQLTVLWRALPRGKKLFTPDEEG